MVFSENTCNLGSFTKMIQLMNSLKTGAVQWDLGSLCQSAVYRQNVEKSISGLRRPLSSRTGGGSGFCCPNSDAMAP